MNTERPASSPFTGRHMLAIMVAFFGVIIAVNITMATLANTSWTGFVVKNTYIASQEFNGKSEAGRRQDALGWSPSLSLRDGVLSFKLTDAEGRAVALSGGTLSLRRPASDRDDLSLELTASASGLVADVELHDGVWIIDILADAGLAEPYREARRVQIRDGELR
jgi:nitrogen fixation protein FixH